MYTYVQQIIALPEGLDGGPPVRAVAPLPLEHLLRDHDRPHPSTTVDSQTQHLALRGFDPVRFLRRCSNDAVPSCAFPCRTRYHEARYPSSRC